MIAHATVEYVQRLHVVTIVTAVTLDVIVAFITPSAVLTTIDVRLYICSKVRKATDFH